MRDGGGELLFQSHVPFLSFQITFCVIVKLLSELDRGLRNEVCAHSNKVYGGDVLCYWRREGSRH